MASIKGVDDDKIPDPWRRGDVVVSLVDRKDVLSVGDMGMIIGPLTGTKPAEQVTVRFPRCPEQVINVTGIAVNLPHGYNRGDKVISHVEVEGKLSVGDVGTVIGSSTGTKPAEQVTVRFPRSPEQIIYVASIKGVDDDKIPAPWRRGDVVVSTIDFDGGHGDVLSVGDVGMIIGPSTGSKPAEQVTVRFPRSPEQVINVAGIMALPS